MSSAPRTVASPPSPLFAALGDPHRLRIVRHLSQRGPLSIAGLTEGSGISRQGVSKHLGILERAGVVRSSRRGRERILALASPTLRDARRFLTDVSTEWESALGRLRRLAEADLDSRSAHTERVSPDAP